MSKETPVSTNMPVLSVEKTILTLSRSYCAVIGKGLSPKILPSVMLWVLPVWVNPRQLDRSVRILKLKPESRW